MQPEIDLLKERIAALTDMGRTDVDTLVSDIDKALEPLEKKITSDSDSLTDEELSTYVELVEIAEKAQGRIVELDATDQKRIDDAKAAQDRLAALRAQNGDGTDEGGDGDGGTGDGDGAGTEGEEVDAVALAASLGRVPTAADLAAAQVQRGGRPKGNGDGGNRSISLTAAANFDAISHRDSFESKEQLATVMANELRRLDPKGAPGSGRIRIATADWSHLYADERRLRKNDRGGNTFKMDSLAQAYRQRRTKGGLVATGGIPLPVNVDYKMEVWASQERPLRDFLPAFGADHGGLTFRNPLTVGDLASATSVWTAATDADPGESTKAIYQVTAQDAVTELVDAIPTRLEFGNMMGQFDPDTIAMNTDLAMAAAARTADLNLLSRLEALSTLVTSATAILGASRNIFAVIDQIIAAFRFSNRLSLNTQLAMIFPLWFKDMIRADRVLELAHDTTNVDPFGITDEWIEDQFDLRGVRVCWMEDGMPLRSSSPAYPTQNFTAFTENTAIPVWPTKVVFWTFIDGSVQFLDGGRLDLGVIRDSTLSQTNDYETFVEPFEGLAFRGFELGLVETVLTCAVNGESAATASA